MFHFFLLFLCISSSFLQAKLEDHFKPALHKTNNSNMRGIDFIYCINLDQRPEKFAHCLRELAPYNITPYRFSAVNGWELSVEDIDDIGVKYDPTFMQGGRWASSFAVEDEGISHHCIVDTPGKTYFGHCTSKGVLGCCLSHLSVLQDAYNCGYQTVWIIEDDILAIKDPHLLSDLIEELDILVGRGGWDMLFTDKDTKDQQGHYVQCKGHAWKPNYIPKYPPRFAKREELGSFIKTTARYGTYSMIIRRSGIEKILNYFKKYNIYLPYDMEFYLPSNMKIYTVSDDVVSTQPTALSDNGSPNYLNQPN